MSKFRRTVLSAVGIGAILGGAQSLAQTFFPEVPAQRPPQVRAPVQLRGENFSAGKSPTQLFASDCSGCHRAAQGLAKNKSAAALGEFMREHYTNSRESAYALASYLNAQRNVAPPPRTPPATPAGAPDTASVPRPPGSIPGEGGTPAGEPPKPVVEQPPKPPPGTAASKRGQRGVPTQAAAKLPAPPVEPPPPPAPEVPEIFD